jgi:uracil-DNA glycosylase
MRPRACDRLRLGNRAVEPEGSLNARLYLVGEAPGRHEAEMGRPFVGPVGAALRDMMREAGIDVSQVRLANAIPFRPIQRSPEGRVRNRRPTDKELRIYAQSVLVDIVKVQPKLIVALGRSAAMLFGGPIPVRRSRTRTLQFQGVPVRFTYHPGFVLRFGGRGSPRWRSAVRDLKRFWNEAQRRRSAHARDRS